MNVRNRIARRNESPLRTFVYVGAGPCRRRTLENVPTTSLEQIRGQISTGKYAIDSSEVAGEILTKLATVRRVRRLMNEGKGEERAPGPRPRRPAPSEPSNLRKPASERLA